MYHRISSSSRRIPHRWIAALSLLCAGAAAAQEALEPASALFRESVEVANHTVFNTQDVVDGATILLRNLRDQVVEATVTTRALEPDTAYSIWWAVFNRPQYCRIAYRCGLGDLEVNGGDPRVRVSVFWGGGLISDNFGLATTYLQLYPGRTTRELFAGSRDYGLIDLRRAEIHLVLRTHGPVGVAGTVGEQLGTANLACPEGGCRNVFASIHRAGESVVDP